MNKKKTVLPKQPPPSPQAAQLTSAPAHVCYFVKLKNVQYHLEELFQ